MVSALLANQDAPYVTQQPVVKVARHNSYFSRVFVYSARLRPSVKDKHALVVQQDVKHVPTQGSVLNACLAIGTTHFYAHLSYAMIPTTWPMATASSVQGDATCVLYPAQTALVARHLFVSNVKLLSFWTQVWASAIHALLQQMRN
jgi:hypothetical protein